MTKTEIRAKRIDKKWHNIGQSLLSRWSVISQQQVAYGPLLAVMRISCGTQLLLVRYTGLISLVPNSRRPEACCRRRTRIKMIFNSVFDLPVSYRYLVFF